MCSDFRQQGFRVDTTHIIDRRKSGCEYTGVKRARALKRKRSALTNLITMKLLFKLPLLLATFWIAARPVQSQTVTIPDWDVSTDDLKSAAITTFNTVYQSDAIQNLPFSVTSNCADSIINDLFFCDSASYSFTEEIPYFDDVCDVACDAVYETCMVAYHSCDAVCFWGDCGCKSIKKACQSARDSCSSGCNEVDYVAASVGLTELKGLGSMALTDVNSFNVTTAGSVAETTVTADLTLVAKSITGVYFYSATAVGINVKDSDAKLTVNEVEARGVGTFFADCIKGGIFMKLDSFTLVNIAWIPKSWIPSGMPGAKDIKAGIDTLNQAITILLDDVLGSVLLDVLNSTVSDISLLDVSC